MMFGNASRSDRSRLDVPDLPRSVRVDAALRLGVRFDRTAIRVEDRHESGALRFRFPRAHGTPPEAVIVNVAGGLAGGDRAATAIAVQDDAALSVTSATAERIYGSAGAVTDLDVALSVKERGTLLWLPQETILHDGARLARRIVVDLARTARMLFGEMLYFGRRASGEGYGFGVLRESWRIRRDGQLLIADETRLDGDFSESIGRPGALGGHVALATLIFAGGDAGDALEAIRARLPDEPGFEAGASDLGGLVIARLASHDAARLRQMFVALAEILAPRIGHGLPRAFAT